MDFVGFCRVLFFLGGGGEGGVLSLRVNRKAQSMYFFYVM